MPSISMWIPAAPASFAHLLTRLLLLGLAVSLVVPLLYGLLRFLPHWSLRVPARLRFRVLAATFALLLGAPLLASLTLFSHGAAAGPVALSAIQPDFAWRISPVYAAVAALLWLLASGWFALRLLQDFLRARQLRRSAQPFRGESVPDPLCAIALSSRVSSPCLIGVFAPLVLLPAHLPAQLAPVQLAAILDHEFAHLRRRDPWTNLLQKLALVVFPLHPGLHLLDRWMSREREHACDEWVLRRAHAARDYAASLVDIASSALHPAPAPLAAVGSRSELASRIERIVRPQPQLPRRFAATLAILLTAGSTSLAALLLSLLPPISFAPASTASATDFPAAQMKAAPGHARQDNAQQAKFVPASFVSSASPASSAPGMILAAYHQPRTMRPEKPKPAAFRAPHARASAPLQALDASWHDPAIAPGQFVGQPVQDASLNTTQTADQFALVVETTTITQSSFQAEYAEPVSAQPGSAPLARAVPAAARQTQPSPPIFYTVVTTTLRITPAQYIRLEQAWLARKL